MKVWFWVRFPVVPKTPAMSLVTVCGASVVLVQTTCVPTLIVSVAGLKAYLSLASTIFTWTTVGVGLGVGCAVVAVGAGVGVEVVVVPPPPHAANSRAATVANDSVHQRTRVCLAKDDRLVFIKNTSCFSRVGSAWPTNSSRMWKALSSED